MTPGLGVLVSGRGSNLGAILDAVEAGRLAARVVLVLSDRPDAAALGIAKSRGVPARFLEPGPSRSRLSPEAEQAYVAALRGAGAEAVALAGFLRIVGRGLLDAFPDRVLNIHPSLLPSFPGLDAPAQALRHGVKVSGATVHLVTEGVDAGPILCQAAVPVLDGDDADTLAARILAEEHRIYPRAIGLVLAGGIRVEGRRVLREPIPEAGPNPVLDRKETPA
jgi:phosphoribosylglycinamide formyltransferase-1